jgi:hypothetical protein
MLEKKMSYRFVGNNLLSYRAKCMNEFLIESNFLYYNEQSFRLIYYNEQLNKEFH